MVFALSEGTFTVNDSKIFIPFNPLKDAMEHRPASLVVDIVPFLVKTKKDLIVIDPGLGLESLRGDFKICENIRSHGFSPDEVTHVLLSHLHKDHAGGICYGKDAGYNLMFSNATYFCQQKEMEYALTNRHSPSYIFEKLEFLNHSSHLEFLDGDGNINSEIHYEVSGGHTPFHQVFFIENENRKFFFGGDVAPQSSQIIRRFIAKYDFDGKRSAQLRREYARRGAAENWIFLFFHDGAKPMVRLKEEHHHLHILPYE